MDTLFLTATQVVLVPVVIGVVEGLKRTGLPSRFAFGVSVLLGIGGAFIFPANNIGLTILAGVIIGLSASGLYSGGKSLVN